MRHLKKDEKGGAILVAVLLALMTGILTGGIVLMTTSSAVQTTVTGHYESAYLVAEAGIKNAIFQNYWVKATGPGETAWQRWGLPSRTIKPARWFVRPPGR